MILALLLATESVVVVSMPPITGKVSLIGGVTLSATIDTNAIQIKGKTILTAADGVQYIALYGSYSFGRTWTLLDSTDSVKATQNGAWTVGRNWNLSSSDLPGRSWALGVGSDNVVAYLHTAGKGSTAGADPTTTAEGANHEALDAQLYHGGVAIDPRDMSDRAARLLGVIYGSQAQQIKQTATNYNLQVELATGGTLYDSRTRSWNIGASDLPGLSSGTSPAQSQTLIGTTSTAITVPANARSCEIANVGASTCYYNPAGASTTSSRPVGGTSIFAPTWTLDCTGAACTGLTGICPSGAQLSGAATVLTCLN